MSASAAWDRAMTYDEYVAQMRENRALFDERLPATEVTERDRQRFGGESLRFLILTEDYCGDSAQFIPAIGRLARELPNIDVRILLRNQERDFAAKYVRKDGYQAIPVIVVLDGTGEEFGYVIERPQVAYAELAEDTRRFVLASPDLEGANRSYTNMPEATRAAVLANSNVFRATRQAAWTRALFDELALIVERARVTSPEAATTD